MSRLILSERAFQNFSAKEVLTIELISIVSAKFFPDKPLNFSKLFTGEDWIWMANEKLQFRKYRTHHCNKTSGKNVHAFFAKKLSILSNFCCLEPGLQNPITDIVEARNTLTQERHNHRDSCITVKLSRRTQKIYIWLA